jgi:hypothetical protein
MDTAPKWIGDFMTDIIYWLHDDYRRDLSEIVPYTIEKIRYKDPSNFTKNMNTFFE